jgi:hypothetical protein
MTQVPRPSQRPVDGPVVPGDASTPGSPAAARTAPATHSHGLPDDLHNALVLAIHKVGIPVVAASAVAEAIRADAELLDALVACRQTPPLGYMVVRRNPDSVRFMPAGKVYPNLEGAQDWRKYLENSPVDRIPTFRRLDATFALAEVREIPETTERPTDA